MKGGRYGPSIGHWLAKQYRCVDRTVAWRWFLLAFTTLIVWQGLSAVEVNAPALLAALAVAMVLALSGIGPDRMPSIAGSAAQGTLAVSIGLLVDPELITSLKIQWIPVVSVATVTLLVSVLMGVGFSLSGRIGLITGILSLAAGGSTGLVAVADDLGADTRIVVITQYLRVSLIVFSMPLAVTYIFSAGGADIRVTDSIQSPVWLSFVFTIVMVVLGTKLAVLVRIPIPATLGPLILTAVLELCNSTLTAPTPGGLVWAASLIIGWQAGLAFTRDSLAVLGRSAPWALSLIVALTVICGGLGCLLSWWTGESMMDGYLATTPGGLSAVLAVATSTGMDSSLVSTSQVVRLVMVLVSAPVLVWLIERWMRFTKRRC